MNGEHGQLYEAIHKIDKEVAKIIEQNDTRDNERKWIIAKLDQLCDNKDNCRREWEGYVKTAIGWTLGIPATVWLIVLIATKFAK